MLLLVDPNGKVLATLNKKNGPYVCMMKVRNPKFKNKGPLFGRPHNRSPIEHKPAKSVR